MRRLCIAYRHEGIGHLDGAAHPRGVPAVGQIEILGGLTDGELRRHNPVRRLIEIQPRLFDILIDGLSEQRLIRRKDVQIGPRLLYLILR